MEVKKDVASSKTAKGFIRPHLAVTLFTLLVATACFLLMLFVLDRGEQRATREQEEKTRLLAHALENTVIRSFQDVIGRLNSIEEALILNPDLLAQDVDALNRILDDLLALTPSLREVVVHDSAGAWIASSRQRPPSDGAVAGKCNARLLQNNHLDYLILEPQPGRYLGGRSPRGNQQHIPVCVLLRDSLGLPFATATGVLNPDYLKELFRPAHEMNPVLLELYHYNGVLLVKGEGGAAALHDHLADLFRSSLKAREYGTYHQTLVTAHASSGNSVITSYRSTSPLPLVMLVHLDLEKGLSAWHQEARFVFWVFVALIAAVLMGGSVLAVALLRKYRMESEIQLLTAAISSTANAIFITDQQGKIQWVNRAFEKLTGWRLQEVRGQTPKVLNSGEHDRRFFHQLWVHILSGQVWRGQLTNTTRDQRNIIVDQTITPILNQYQEITHFVAVHEDVTARTRAEAQARFLARHDALTALPNRRSFAEALGDALAMDDAHLLAILFIDLDHFKTINDTLGHQAGDEVLRISTERMRGQLPDHALLARLGGDEFSVLIRSLNHTAEVQRLVEALLQVMAQPVQLGESRFSLSASVGVTFGQAGQDDAATLLRQADLAMYKAKHDGRNTFSFFDEKMDYAMHHHVKLEQGLRAALSQNQGLLLCYQPIIAAHNLQPVAVEVLMRWRNSAGEWISPAEFIPVAEGNGLILELGRWQLRELFERLNAWQQGALRGLKVSINISAVQLARDNIAEVLVAKMFQHGIRPEQLVVEVTETTLMTESTRLRENLDFLRDSGVSLSIDDFGTGYSSLSYISELDAHLIKIDRSFVQGIGKSHSDEEIILATIALARNLDMRVVAEGVEEGEQRDFLIRAGVDYLQGYLFARPMFESELTDFIAGCRRQLTATVLHD